MRGRGSVGGVAYERLPYEGAWSEREVWDMGAWPGSGRGIRGEAWLAVGVVQ